MMVGLASASWAVIALSFAALAFVVQVRGHRSLVAVVAGVSVFLICGLVAVRSLVRFRKLAEVS